MISRVCGSAPHEHRADLAIMVRTNTISHMLCRAFIAAFVALLVCVGLGAQTLVAPRLNEVKSWTFQLQNVDPVDIKLSPYDLVVIDYGFDRRNATAFPREVVDLMRTKPDGRRCLLFAYFSIGEAENYRYYWHDSWLTNRPEWLEPENPDWPGNYLVRYWSPQWQAILFGSPDAYLDRILGFDGIYIDGVDKFEEWKRRRPNAAADMIALVGWRWPGVQQRVTFVPRNPDGQD